MIRASIMLSGLFPTRDVSQVLWQWCKTLRTHYAFLASIRQFPGLKPRYRCSRCQSMVFLLLHNAYVGTAEELWLTDDGLCDQCDYQRQLQQTGM